MNTFTTQTIDKAIAILHARKGLLTLNRRRTCKHEEAARCSLQKYVLEIIAADAKLLALDDEEPLF